MNDKISHEIQSEQDRGRQKYRRSLDGIEHDNRMPDDLWHSCIADHNRRAEFATPMERRQHLIKVAGLAVSAVEAFDRKRESQEAKPDPTVKAPEYVTTNHGYKK